MALLRMGCQAAAGSNAVRFTVDYTAFGATAISATAYEAGWNGTRLGMLNGDAGEAWGPGKHVITNISWSNFASNPTLIINFAGTNQVIPSGGRIKIPQWNIDVARDDLITSPNSSGTTGLSGTSIPGIPQTVPGTIPQMIDIIFEGENWTQPAGLDDIWTDTNIGIEMFDAGPAGLAYGFSNGEGYMNTPFGTWPNPVFGLTWTWIGGGPGMGPNNSNNKIQLAAKGLPEPEPPRSTLRCARLPDAAVAGGYRYVVFTSYGVGFEYTWASENNYGQWFIDNVGQIRDVRLAGPI